MKYVIIIILFSTSVGYSQFNSNKNKKVTYKELAYGVCTTEVISKEEMTSSPSGAHTISDNFRIIKQTNKIPGIIGQTFGVQYVLESPTNQNVELEQAWIFPLEMTNEKGERFQEVRYFIVKATNEVTYSSYTFEKEHEIVKGKWLYQMLLKGEILCQKEFWIE